MFSQVGLSRSLVLLVGVVLGMLLTVGVSSQHLWTASARLPGSVIADFLMIRDSSFDISGTESKTIQFDLPADTDLGGMAVIAFVFRPTTDAQDLTVEIQLNGNVITPPLLIGRDITRGIWETFNQEGKDLKLTGNILQFTVKTGTGSIGIRDVVLWYHRTI
ncbi:MAG: hypothetical protein A2Z21_04765 [Candidatus Fraserbacteria bacterium RBG_16_55_9]|uniref:Uncharacterized protein n=1 Tax=Fraserbacteria sp. (strain RBG_16_55_9) TaxID=1817864 RepID=A0A1F5UVA7_FRAXR|nr:MAG: hypothetical protein A2Z21_04765 [Candidatus Fraserbacteria bacterium RBG_16_55_9]